MVITVYEVFELNRIMHKLNDTQMSYEIGTAFEIHNLMKWLDDTETYVFERFKLCSNDGEVNFDDPIIQTMLNSQIRFIDTPLTTEDLRKTIDSVEITVDEASLLKKVLDKTES